MIFNLFINAIQKPWLLGFVISFKICHCISFLFQPNLQKTAINLRGQGYIDNAYDQLSKLDLAKLRSVEVM